MAELFEKVVLWIRCKSMCCITIEDDEENKE